jgi:ElaB/YqjD/DUF883 family membrane-anchored ribosome-binding protein
MDTTSTLNVPSGFEVESASLHIPTGPPVDAGHQLPEATWKERLNEIPSTVRERVASVGPMVMSKVDSVRGSMRTMSSKWQQTMHERSTQMQQQMRASSMKMQDHMRNNTTMWAGIAAGLGLGAGLLGRVARHRHHHAHERMPGVVIIEASC